MGGGTLRVRFTCDTEFPFWLLDRPDRGVWVFQCEKGPGHSGPHSWTRDGLTVTWDREESDDV